MVRERRRQTAPLPQPEEVAAPAETGSCPLRDKEESGSITVEEAGLELRTLEDTDALRGRSQGAVDARRNEAGLI